MNNTKNCANIQNKSDKKIFNLLAEKLVREADDNFIYFKDYETAMSQVNEVLRIEPDHPKALILKGNLMLYIDKDHEALKCFEQAIDADPQSAEAYGSKAGMLDLFGKQKEALQFCEKAFQHVSMRDRDLVISLYDQKISILLKMKKFKEAGMVLNQSFQSLPEEGIDYLASSYQKLIDVAHKEKLRKRKMASKLSLRLVCS